MSITVKKIAGVRFFNIYRHNNITFEGWYKGYHFVIERIFKVGYDIEVRDPRGCLAVNTIEAVSSMDAAIAFALEGAGLTQKTPPLCPPSSSTTLTQTST